MKYFLLLVISFYTLPGFAVRPSCNGVLEDDLRPFKLASTVLTLQDRELIKRIFNSSDSSEVKWKAILETYLYARMQTVPVTHRAAAVKYMKELKVEFVSEGSFDANSRSVRLPKKFADTVMPFIILTHEWEHRLQTVELFGDGNLFTYHVKSIRRAINPFAIFKAEEEAMKAEWEMLSIVPQELIEDSIQILLKMPSSKLRDTGLKILDGQRLSREEYIRLQHSHGRHTISKIIKNYFRIKPK